MYVLPTLFRVNATELCNDGSTVTASVSTAVDGNNGTLIHPPYSIEYDGSVQRKKRKNWNTTICGVEKETYYHVDSSKESEQVNIDGPTQTDKPNPE